MSYDSSSFSRSSNSFSRSSRSAEEKGERRRRKVRKKRRKTMTADDMRKGVTFQTGLTGKAKLALAAVVMAGLGLTVVVMLAVNGSFKLTNPNDNPENHNFKGNEGFDLDAFAPDRSQPAAPMAPAAGAQAPAPAAGGDATPAESKATPAKPVDDFFKNSPFEE